MDRKVSRARSLLSSTVPWRATSRAGSSRRRMRQREMATYRAMYCPVAVVGVGVCPGLVSSGNFDSCVLPRLQQVRPLRLKWCLGGFAVQSFQASARTGGVLVLGECCLPACLPESVPVNFQGRAVRVPVEILFDLGATFGDWLLGLRFLLYQPDKQKPIANAPVTNVNELYPRS